MNHLTQTTRDDFEYWLCNMDDFLEELFSQAPDEYRPKLDFTPASLDVVEKWILELFKSSDHAIEPAEKKKVNGLACYVGETFRRGLGGKWTIGLDDPKFVYHALPILTGSKAFAAPACPLTLITACANRRRGNYLSTIFENMKRRLTNV